MRAELKDELEPSMMNRFDSLARGVKAIDYRVEGCEAKVSRGRDLYDLTGFFDFGQLGSEMAAELMALMRAAQRRRLESLERFDPP